MDAYLQALEKKTKEDFSQYTLTRNKVDPYWKAVLKAYKNEYNFDLNYMKYELDVHPHWNDGRVCTTMKSIESAGSWTKLQLIYLNPEMYKVKRHYHPELYLTNLIMREFVFRIIAHELGHEVYRNKASDEFKSNIALKVSEENFTTEYLQQINVSAEEYKEEQFCEYISHYLTDKYLEKFKDKGF